MRDESFRDQIIDFAKAVCSAADYRSALSIAASGICDQLRAENVLIWIYSDEQELHREASRLTTLSGDTLANSVSANSELIRAAVESNTARLLGPYNAPPASTLVEGTGVSSAMVVALRDRSR